MPLTPLPQQTLVLKNPKGIKIEDFEISRVLGEGSFGRVKLVKNI
jgi:serine/threonine protein kinase